PPARGAAGTSVADLLGPAESARPELAPEDDCLRAIDNLGKLAGAELGSQAAAPDESERERHARRVCGGRPLTVDAARCLTDAATFADALSCAPTPDVPADAFTLADLRARAEALGIDLPDIPRDPQGDDEDESGDD